MPVPEEGMSALQTIVSGEELISNMDPRSGMLFARGSRKCLQDEQSSQTNSYDVDEWIDADDHDEINRILNEWDELNNELESEIGKKQSNLSGQRVSDIGPLIVMTPREGWEHEVLNTKTNLPIFTVEDKQRYSNLKYQSKFGPEYKYLENKYNIILNIRKGVIRETAAISRILMKKGINPANLLSDELRDVIGEEPDMSDSKLGKLISSTVVRVLNGKLTSQDSPPPARKLFNFTKPIKPTPDNPHIAITINDDSESSLSSLGSDKSFNMRMSMENFSCNMMGGRKRKIRKSKKRISRKGKKGKTRRKTRGRKKRRKSQMKSNKKKKTKKG
tara:strand:+ start:31 stop:1026 length:996 start_codon:yes stop_codon:yes gene_type:complete